MKKVNYENNWKSKSLESLEKDVWRTPEQDNRLEMICYQLRKKPVGTFEIEDLRIMIGQSIGLQFLIPLAIEKLKTNVLTEGDFYPGDLLSSVLTSDPGFWIDHPGFHQEVVELAERNWDLIPKKLREEMESFHKNR